MIVTLSKAAKPPLRSVPVSPRTAKPFSKIWVPPREDEVECTNPANQNVASSRQMNIDQSAADNGSHDSNSKKPSDQSERSDSESETHLSDEKSRSHDSANCKSNTKEPELGSSNPRPGLPSVRPNAMKNRQKQLEALLKYEKRFRHADIVGPSDADSPRLSQNLHNIRQQKSHNSTSLASLMALHILDISKILEHGAASWQTLNFEMMVGAPVETIFYTLIEGRGEILMFGGKEKDMHALQRGQGTQSHTMNNALFVLSPVQQLL